MAEVPPIYQALTEVLQESRYARKSPATAMTLADTAVKLQIPGGDIASIHDFFQDHKQMTEIAAHKIHSIGLNAQDGEQ